MSAAEANIFRKSRLLNSGVENYHVTDEPTWTASMDLPGLAYESMDRDGHPRIQSLMLLAGLAKVYALSVPYDDDDSVFLDWPTLLRKALSFVSTTEISVSKKMYDLRISKKRFSAKLMLGHVGNSTLSCITWLYLPGIKEPVVEEVGTLATVDKVTRKVTALPDWFKERYQGKGALDKLQGVEPMQRPSSTYLYKIKVGWSDTDNYTHTNFASYAKFAVDGIHAALLDMKKRREKTGSVGEIASNGCDNGTALKGLTEDIVKNGVKNIKVIYLNETFEGYVMDAHIWQEPNDPYVVKCAIENCRRDSCHVVIEYFENSQ